MLCTVTVVTAVTTVLTDINRVFVLKNLGKLVHNLYV